MYPAVDLPARQHGRGAFWRWDLPCPGVYNRWILGFWRAPQGGDEPSHVAGGGAMSRDHRRQLSDYIGGECRRAEGWGYQGNDEDKAGPTDPPSPPNLPGPQ